MTLILSTNPRTCRTARPLPRRSAWVLACLWLLMVLVPLRAWASAEMMVAMAVPHAPVSAAHANSGPPCHSVANAAPGELDGTGTGVHGTACGDCQFCASALAAVSQDARGPFLAPDVPPTAFAVVPPSGDPEPFFRPPRG